MRNRSRAAKWKTVWKIFRELVALAGILAAVIVSVISLNQSERALRNQEQTALLIELQPDYAKPVALVTLEPKQEFLSQASPKQTADLQRRAWLSIVVRVKLVNTSISRKISIESIRQTETDHDALVLYMWSVINALIDEQESNSDIQYMSKFFQVNVEPESAITAPITCLQDHQPTNFPIQLGPDDAKCIYLRGLIPIPGELSNQLKTFLETGEDKSLRNFEKFLSEHDVAASEPELSSFGFDLYYLNSHVTIEATLANGNRFAKQMPFVLIR